ncbi:type IV conjugative transfer system coupling protein TraD [Salmonella enterica subsp. enterica serovar Richmond]|uniref:Type IV conjugative transfer system coupling protein TraD n=1 Tax=Salmonella enterica TaxID=28901 RepID=A0A759MVC7_SALER|nr:type IV conjugative transfer system coupling protein TraD [Salmonella enterica subsp. enterica serovar Richmond]EDR9034421.1 type IV conjugative transfer system coupling protein TraD [Salmonella enterica subsp. enterica serovar Richmond]HAG1984702.1 type IV conjugative transfer system coupling protein TraD [Salmonella enterica]
MSSTKHITQGGQVFSYMLNMFMQVNRRIAFWLLNLFFVLTPLFFWMRVPWQDMRNGGLYWWLYLSAGGEKALFNVPPVYDVPYDGQILHFTSAAILKDPYMTYAGQLTLQELFIAVFLASCVVLAVAYGVYYLLRRLGEKQAQDDLVGGRSLTEDVKSVARMLQKEGKASPLHIDQLPLVNGAEVQNMLMHGTPGAGKSNALNKLLKQLRQRGDMVIVYDKGCSLVKRHFNENVDKLLNPLDKRCEFWDLWLECQSTPDYDSMGNTLIPQGTKEDPFWTGAARTIFTAVSSRLKNDPDRSYNRLLRTLLAINLKALREYVAGSEAANLMEEKVEKTAISIRGVLTNYVKALRYLQGIERTGKPRFAIREWMKQVNEPDQRNGWLWITSNARQHESLKPLISMWLAQAANCLLEMGENPTRRVWFIFDELYSLHKLPELPGVLAEARKFGGCFVLGFQNKPQMDVIYGSDFATAMMDLLNTRFFYRSPDEEVASYVMRQLGQRRAKVFNEQYSYGADTVRDGVSFSKQEEDQYLVNYSDIQSLPDLSCYATLPGKYPVVRMNMTYEKMDFIAAEFLPRELNDSLDQEIEEEITRRELDEDSIDRLLAVQSNEPVVPATTAPVATVSSVTAATETINSSPLPPATVSSSVPDTRSSQATTSPVQNGGRVKEYDGLQVDTQTGEILTEPDRYEDYAAYEQEALQAMKEEEKNILVHREHDEPDREYEPGDRW